MALLNRASGPQ